MNQRTVRLLRKWALKSGKGAKEVKRWWLTLNRKERTKERKRLHAEIEAGS